MHALLDLRPKWIHSKGAIFADKNDSKKTLQVRQPAAILKYASSSHPNDPARGDVGGRMRLRGEKMRGGDLT